MAIIGAFMVPHPPMIVPEVGKGSEKQIAVTTAAYARVAQEIAALAPETIILSSPHATMYRDYFHISPGSQASGSFGSFRAPEVKFREEYDTELVKTIERIAQGQGFPAGTKGQREPALDHGTMVPLYFIRQAYLAVSKVMTDGSESDENRIYESLCRLWLSHGSSAPIFQMAYEEVKGHSLDRSVLKNCVDAFRNAEFEIDLSARTVDFLNLTSDQPKAIITDGNSILQRKKYEKLKLNRWIDEDNVFISGDYGRQFYKPYPYMGELVKQKIKADRYLYYGDRDIDEEFAQRAGFEFIRVRNMMI